LVPISLLAHFADGLDSSLAWFGGPIYLTSRITIMVLAVLVASTLSGIVPIALLR
jgi:hypothetical protein